MRAIRIHQFGDTDNLKLEEVPQPQPLSGEVLIRTQACGVNPIDWKTCSGGGATPFIGDLPFIPGWEFAGVIESVTNEAEGLQPGDPVYGMIRFPDPAGCYAEYLVAPANQICKRPAELDAVTAGGLATAGLTAWQALFDKGEMKTGQKVLVLGAAGGVGHLAVQLAALHGAEVFGTASSKNHAFVTALGAKQLFDYQDTDITAAVQEMDLIIDAVGGETAIQALPCLKPGGRMVTLPSVTKDAVIAAGDIIGVKVLPIRCEPNAGQLAKIAQLYADKKLCLNIADSLPLAEVAEAFKRSAEGHVRGKLVLTL